MVIAGRRWGKTVYLRERLLANSERAGSTNIYVAPTRIQAKDIMWTQLKQRISDLRWTAIINESELKITRSNGSTIELKSAEKPGRMRGRGIDYVVMDEFSEFRYFDEVWNQVVRPALSDKRGYADFTGTPKGFNHGWDLYNQAKSESDWSNYTFKTIDSPFFQTEEGRKEIDDARKNLSEKDFRQEYEASFENFSGRIYHTFDRTYCISDAEYNPDLPLIVGQDFNRSPMSSCIFQKMNGVLHQIDEIFLTVSDTPEVCRVVGQRYKTSPSNIIFRPDATGSRRTSNSSQSDHEIIKSFGYRVEVNASNPKRLDRWAAVNRAFEKELVRINVKRCPKTVKDLETLCYKEGTCEPMLNDPLLGHLSDAFGYAVCKEFPIMGRVKQFSYA